MRITESDGSTIRRDPATVQYLRDLLEEQVELTDVQPALQRWGLQAAHFTAHMLYTGRPVVVKVGMSSREFHYAREVSARDPDLAPQVFASGTTQSDLSVNWAAFEPIPYGPLGPMYRGHEFRYLIRAGVRFQQVAREIKPVGVPTLTMTAFLRRLKNAAGAAPPGPVDTVLAHFPERWEWLASACPSEICHGDLHLGNGLTRNPPPQGPVVLIDFDPVRQPWCLDAAYLEALNCGDRSRKGVGGQVQQMAEERAIMGLPTLSGADLETAATLTVGWFCIAMWQPGREAELPDYIEATEDHISACAALTV